ncbi:MAG: hypothetical protein KR126chlam5_01342 [Candidatus Anoxychlamydiales bacterium]|nr:hypothetical protein [Candidatus Anoxychlamydiales bacterium]
MAKPFTWAGELELNALVYILYRPIVSLNQMGFTKVYNKDSKNKPIFLKVVDSNHYISLSALAGKDLNVIFTDILKSSRYPPATTSEFDPSRAREISSSHFRREEDDDDEDERLSSPLGVSQGFDFSNASTNNFEK